MISDSNIHPEQARAIAALVILERVADSLKKAGEGKSGGRSYVRIDPLTKELISTDKKKEAASFEEISKFMQEIVNNQNIDQKTKDKITDRYQFITEKLADDSELLSKIGSKLADNMRPISADSPFNDTDMVVFKDDYRGILPRNGIKESELIQINQIYNDIAKGQSKILIDSQDEKFKQEILLSIKTLLTREIGRKLIKKVIGLKDETIIQPGTSSQLENNVVFLNLSQVESIRLIGQQASGKLASYPVGTFIALGHELIHRLYPNASQRQLKSTISSNYDNLEEQIAITGLKKGLSISATSNASDNWEPILSDGYEELNERNLTEAFAGSLTEYYSKKEIMRYPREGHSGISTKDLGVFIMRLIQANLLYDLEVLFKERLITKDILNSTFKPGIFHRIAIQTGRAEALKLLLKIDPNPESTAADPLLLVVTKNVGDLRTTSQLHPVIDALLEAGIDVNSVDKKGNTPLHYFALLGEKECIKKIIGHGGEMRRNMRGQDPIDFVVYDIVEKEWPNDLSYQYILEKFGYQEITLEEVQKNDKLKSKLNEKFHNLFQLMKEIYSQDDLIKKLTDVNFYKRFLVYGDEDSILECLKVLHESNIDFRKGEENSILHYALQSGYPRVRDNLKDWNVA